MSQKEPVVFLCCYCGALIQKNVYNLKRHEKIHTNHKKVKCAATNCGKTMHKDHYWMHWEKQHKSAPMLDELKFVDVVGHQPKGIKKKSHETNESKFELAPESPNNFHLLNALGLTHKVETKFQSTIAACIMKDPFFGDLK